MATRDGQRGSGVDARSPGVVPLSAPCGTALVRGGLTHGRPWTWSYVQRGEVWTFTPEQEEWLEFIRRHLAVNLSIDRGDFEVLPVFTQRGGLGKARKVFGSELDELIRRLNEAVAA